MWLIIDEACGIKDVLNSKYISSICSPWSTFPATYSTSINRFDKQDFPALKECWLWLSNLLGNNYYVKTSATSILKFVTTDP